MDDVNTPQTSFLIATINKRQTLAMLKQWRAESTTKDEADAFADVIDAIMSGELDG